MGLQEKETELQAQIKAIQEAMNKNEHLSSDDYNSKKFLLNVLEARLSRQKRHTNETFSLAEKRILSDPRLTEHVS